VPRSSDDSGQNGYADDEKPRATGSKWRNPSDLTDEEWTHLEGQGWRQQAPVNIREVVNGILSTRCQWQAIPKDLSPRSMVFD
jgi:hypothetical protein